MTPNKKKILILVGTRPNFIKVTQFKRIAKTTPSIDVKIVHTGQHYDTKMSDIFFDQFGLQPDFFLNIAPSSPISQMANIMTGLEKLITNDYTPDLLIVPGDVNSTFAGALTANKMGIRIAHLESGLRSFDREMPEEINRLLTDEISDYYFVTEASGTENLKKENKKGKVFFVGNTMIDTLVAFEKEIEQSGVLSDYNLEKGKYLLMTIHRPSNVDTREGLKKLARLIQDLSKDHKIIFPVHPRTLDKAKILGVESMLTQQEGLILTAPLGYFEFQKLIKYSKLVLTDSGGIQEETTYRKVPCLTLRENTERPVTVNIGSNTLIPFDLGIIKNHIKQIEEGACKEGDNPPLWDGKATERILEVISML